MSEIDNIILEIWKEEAVFQKTRADTYSHRAMILYRRLKKLRAELEAAQEIATKEEMMLDCYVPDWHKVFAHDTEVMR
jgi:hypothetical protein